jgi:hypothetical protein
MSLNKAFAGRQFPSDRPSAGRRRLILERLHIGDQTLQGLSALGQGAEHSIMGELRVKSRENRTLRELAWACSTAASGKGLQLHYHG